MSQRQRDRRRTAKACRTKQPACAMTSKVQSDARRIRKAREAAEAEAHRKRAAAERRQFEAELEAINRMALQFDRILSACRPGRP
ncbi:hypothetical protein [Acuticoccus mangrovi]|uniref:Uncharacterized protein n=1 Tax=Acuticoccus mangrovi TaxID=2796142 RepID=A0A934IU96_9HYPH|nr:hypothetical protein [Acuticoccus mangrovi]MBJ3778282.1 hypothetical protein [Acuticoccus mangrovi]